MKDKFMKKISLFLISFLFICNSYAIITGNFILPICKSAIRVENNNYMAPNGYSLPTPEQNTNTSYCMGFVSSAADVAIALKLTCVPPTSIYEQYTRVFVKYLDNHPDKLNLAAADLVAESLKAAYPCPSTPPPAPAKK
jgi:hypothetical protein